MVNGFILKVDRVLATLNLRALSTLAPQSEIPSLI